MEDNFQLDEFQSCAISYARKNYSVIVSAPTGAGKTLIAEYIIEDCIRNGEGVVYTAPIKALSNQKFRDLSKKYPGKVGLLTGDISINPRAEIMIMTTEIFRNAILTEPQRFKTRTWIIFDEIHYLDDIERGTVWEETIILLPKHMRLLALSATLPNIDEFISWLNSVHNFPIKKVVERIRPVPLNLRAQCDNRIFQNIKELQASGLLHKKTRKKSYTAAHIKYNRLSTLITHLSDCSLLPCIYFSFSRKKCEEFAGEICGFNFLTKEQSDKLLNTFKALVAKFDIGDDPNINLLYPLIKNGIAYHHAGLLPALKETIERLFSTGLLKMIFATETFALGINMPAKTVVFDAIYKYYGRSFHYLKTRDFYQMAGRAGRRNIDKQGYIYLRIRPFRYDFPDIEKILYGKYEPITSQLRSCYATILNLYRIMQEKLYDIYPRSFHFYQANQFRKKEAFQLLKRKVLLLKEMDYITEDGISSKGILASKVYSFELQIGQLYESGFLDGLDELGLFKTICSLVYEPRKNEQKAQISKKTKRIKRDLKGFIEAIHREERKFQIYPISKRFYFDISEAARAWYEGYDFYKLYKFCYADEGEILRYFRMTIQVLKEVRSSEVIKAPLASTINNCLKKVNRGIINAENQLRREI